MRRKTRNTLVAFLLIGVIITSVIVISNYGTNEVQTVLNTKIENPLDIILKSTENFNSSDPIVGVWRNTKDENPTWDYKEYRIYANGSYKSTSYSKTSWGWRTKVEMGSWINEGVNELYARINPNYNTVRYHLRPDDTKSLIEMLFMEANNTNSMTAGGMDRYYRMNS